MLLNAYTAMKGLCKRLINLVIQIMPILMYTLTPQYNYSHACLPALLVYKKESRVRLYHYIGQKCDFGILSLAL